MEKSERMYNLAESSFIFSCRESHPGILPAVAIRGSFAFFAAPRRRDLGTGFPMLPFSRSNLPTCSSYIYLPYLRYMCPTSRRRRRFAQLNTIRSVFCFPFLSPLIYFTGLQHASINVYNAARSPSLFSL